MGLRQILPVQTKRTLFTMTRRACERADNVCLNRNKVNRMRRLARRFVGNSQAPRKALQSASAFDLEKNSPSAGVGGCARGRETGAVAIARGLLSVRARSRHIDVDPRSPWPPSCA